MILQLYNIVCPLYILHDPSFSESRVRLQISNFCVLEGHNKYIYLVQIKLYLFKTLIYNSIMCQVSCFLFIILTNVKVAVL